MTREQTLEQEVQALKDLVDIQKQIIEALKLQAQVQIPIHPPYIAPYIHPVGPIPLLTDYPVPLVGDVPDTIIVTSYGDPASSSCKSTWRKA